MSMNQRCWVEVSLARIAANYREIQAVVGPQTELACVVKSEAYGHGMEPVASRLVKEGARWLAVSSTDEGVKLRRAGIEIPILVMADTLPANFARMLDHRLTPSVHDYESLLAFNQLAIARGARAGVHLKVDSGMGRLGLEAEGRAIVQAVSACPQVEILGLMSHLASAADFEGTQTEQQELAFSRLAAELAAAGIRPRWRHISASGAVAYGRRSAWLDMVRVGLSLYGYVPQASGPARQNLLKVKPALRWKARVLCVKQLPEGAPVGYGACHVTTRPTRIAVVSAGYADGLLRQLSGHGWVRVGGGWRPMLGAISMDLCTIDASDAPGLAPGSEVELLGEGFDAAAMAGLAGTIPYDVLCKIHPRATRVYLEDPVECG